MVRLFEIMDAMSCTSELTINAPKRILHSEGRSGAREHELRFRLIDKQLWQQNESDRRAIETFPFPSIELVKRKSNIVSQVSNICFLSQL